MTSLPFLSMSTLAIASDWFGNSEPPSLGFTSAGASLTNRTRSVVPSSHVKITPGDILYSDLSGVAPVIATLAGGSGLATGAILGIIGEDLDALSLVRRPRVFMALTSTQVLKER